MKDSLQTNPTSLFMANFEFCQPKIQANSTICQPNWLLYDFVIGLIEQTSFKLLDFGYFFDFKIIYEISNYFIFFGLTSIQIE
jgi:hypothetical protein